MIKIYNTDAKIAIIADLHLGAHSNSETWHKITLDYGNWLKSELQKYKIRDILILGDIFNDREEIGVKTLSVTQQFFKLFSDPLDTYNILLLNGNHDSYLRDSSDINSISIFKGWNNITVIDKMESFKIKQNNYTFLPWGSTIEDIPDNTSALFGHLEINTFKKNAIKLCDDGIDSSVLLAKAKMVVSGHFHLRDERDYKNGKVIYVGSPYQIDFNDLNTTKGYYIFDLNDMSYEFCENSVSPKYYKIPFSDFFDPPKLVNIKKCIPNNFIKIQVDKEIDYSKLEKIMNTLALLKPLELSSDFSDNENIATVADYETVHLDTKSLITEFVESLEIKASKDKVLKELEDIYNRSITKVTIENV